MSSDCRWASRANSSEPTSGTQIVMGFIPCLRSFARCLRTRSLLLLDIIPDVTCNGLVGQRPPEVFGHASIAITGDVYGHVSPTSAEALDTLSEALR